MEYSGAAWEQAMRMQDVILRAMSGEIHWFQAADILQMTPRNLRRWRERYERWGYNGLVDQRRCPSKHRVPSIELERVLRLYRDRYRGFNGQHFHEIVRREHGVTLSYSYVKQALQQAGLLPKRSKMSVKNRSSTAYDRPPHSPAFTSKLPAVGNGRVSSGGA